MGDVLLMPYVEGIITGMGLTLLVVCVASRSTLRRIESDAAHQTWAEVLMVGAALFLTGLGLFTFAG